MSDHIEVARRLAAKGGVHDDGNINDVVNMGMVQSGGDSTQTQLVAVRHAKRQVVVIVVVGNTNATPPPSSSSLTRRTSVVATLIPDPFHDSNKLYGVLRSLPLRQTFQFQLEDLGIEEIGCVGQPPDRVIESFGPSNLIGGAWLDDESRQTDWPADSRIGLVVGSRQDIASTTLDYTILAVSTRDVFDGTCVGSSTITCAELQEVISKIGDGAPPTAAAYEVIIPVLMPIRLETIPGRVVFYG